MTTTKFKPGQSGNPKGRPAGSGFAGKARDQLQKDWPAIRKVLIEKAKGGDMAAIRIVAERVCPALKPVEPVTALPLDGGSLTDKASAVFASLAKGDVSTASAAQLLSALGGLAKVIETDEILKRLDALEKAQRGKREA